jgi:hypothetical protein
MGPVRLCCAAVTPPCKAGSNQGWDDTEWLSFCGGETSTRRVGCDITQESRRKARDATVYLCSCGFRLQAEETSPFVPNTDRCGKTVARP